MTEQWQTTLWLGAFRYYCGRMTYAVGDFCDLLIAEWGELPEATRALIRRDLSEEFGRDDAARERGAEHLPLGADCDRAQWERVRRLWGAADPARDNCEVCKGERGGVPGNENIVGGRVVCDYCHAAAMKGAS